MAVFSGNGSAASPSFTFSSDTDTGIFRSNPGQLGITTDGTQQWNFQGASLVKGDGSATPVGGFVHGVVLQSVSQTQGATQTLFLYNNNASGPRITFAKSRSTTLGSYSPVQTGDDLGSIAWAGDDGTDVSTRGAFIGAVSAATPPSANRCSTNLVFGTTAPTGTSPISRMLIGTNGNVDIGGTPGVSPNIQLTAAGNGYFNGGTIRVGSGVYTSTYTGFVTDSTGSNTRFEVQVSFPETSAFDIPWTIEVMGAHPLYNGNVVHYKAAAAYKSNNNLTNTAIISENNTNTLTISDAGGAGVRTVSFNSRRPISNTGTAVNCTVFVIITGGIVPTSVTITDV